MPSLDDIFDKAGNMSKLELAKIFYQLTIEEGSRDNTTFCSPFGKYRYKRVLFGLKNAPAHFQKKVEKALRGCREFSSPYIDNVLIFSKTLDEHIEHIRRVLVALREACLTAKLNKCEWGREYLTYLGHFGGKGLVAVSEF